MSEIYLTSDTHYNHSHLCLGVSGWDDKSGCRNFQNLEEMNSTITENINSIVKENDILWHLGDFAMGQKKFWPDFRNSIKCKNIYLLAGNHCPDYNKLGYHWFFKEIFGKKGEYTILHRKIAGKEFCMSHFPVLSWDNKNKDSIMVHGHCHNSMSKWICNHMNNSKIMDVGIDAHPEFRPYHVDEVLQIMAQKTGDDFIDHHQTKREGPLRA